MITRIRREQNSKENVKPNVYSHGVTNSIRTPRIVYYQRQIADNEIRDRSVPTSSNPMLNAKALYSHTRDKYVSQCNILPTSADTSHSAARRAHREKIFNA